MKMKQLLLTGAVVCAFAATGCASGNTANNAAKLRSRTYNTANRTVTNARRALATPTPAPLAAVTPRANAGYVPQTLNNSVTQADNYESYINSRAPQTYQNNNPYAYSNVTNNAAQTRNGVVTNRTGEVARNESRLAQSHGNVQNQSNVQNHNGVQNDMYAQNYNAMQGYSYNSEAERNAMRNYENERYASLNPGATNYATTRNNAAMDTTLSGNQMARNNAVVNNANTAVQNNATTNNATTNNVTTSNAVTNNAVTTRNNAITGANTIAPNRTTTSNAAVTRNNAVTLNNTASGNWMSPSPYTVTTTPYAAGSDHGANYTGSNYTGANYTGMAGGALIY